MKKILSYVQKHPFLTSLFVFLVLVILPPLLINILYKIPAIGCIPQNEIPPGNLLSYFGTVLTFCATFSLSTIVYIQNKNKSLIEKLITNEASISVIEGSSAYIDIFSGLIIGPVFKFIFEINLFSTANISSVKLKSISFGKNLFDTNKYNVYVELHNEQFIIKKKEAKIIELCTRSIEINRELESFLKKSDNLGVRMSIEIMCNNVITPVNISLDLQKQKLEKQNALEYSVDNSFISNRKPQIKEDN